MDASEKMEIDSRVEAKLIALNEERAGRVRDFSDGFFLGFLAAYIIFVFFAKRNTVTA